MHKTVIKRVLSAPLHNATIQQEINPIIDLLANDSPTLPAAVDDLIATVYSPQDKGEMLHQLHDLEGVIDSIRSHLDSLFVSEPVGELLKEAMGAGKKTPDVKRWFGTCFEEIKKLIAQMSTTLQDAQ